MAYDATGASSIEEASNTSDIQIPDMDADMDVVFQWRKVDSEWFAACHEDYTSGMNIIKRAIAYIRMKQHLFGHLKEITCSTVS